MRAAGPGQAWAQKKRTASLKYACIEVGVLIPILQAVFTVSFLGPRLVPGPPNWRRR